MASNPLFYQLLLVALVLICLLLHVWVTANLSRSPKLPLSHYRLTLRMREILYGRPPEAERREQPSHLLIFVTG